MSRYRPYKIIELYKEVIPSGELLPTDTNLDFWDLTYGAATAEYDREFARRYKNFYYFDFLEEEDKSASVTNFKFDVLSILTMNRKRYEELYRIYVVTDEDDPLTYNYDLTETTGAQHQSNVKGSQENTIGQHTDTIGAQTNTHSVAPYNEATFAPESQDVSAQRQDTIGQHTDTEGARTDTIDTNEWTLTKRGNIGVQTASDMLRLHTDFWTKTYKFMELIFDDIQKQLLLVGDC